MPHSPFTRMTDIHCHILPGIDDGSKDWGTTMEMCRFAQADGIRHIVATPHANHQYTYDRERLAELLDELRDKVPEIRFSLGCDFHLSHENVTDAACHPERYSIEGSCYLLVELSDFQTPRQMMDNLFKLHSAGFMTIISHPERNPIIGQCPDLPQQFVDMGSTLQITASSLLGDWGTKAKKRSETLIKKRLVSFIATDAHDPKFRKPLLSPARKAAANMIGADLANLLVLENPGFVVSNAETTPPPRAQFPCPSE